MSERSVLKWEALLTVTIRDLTGGNGANRTETDMKQTFHTPSDCHQKVTLKGTGKRQRCLSLSLFSPLPPVPVEFGLHKYGLRACLKKWRQASRPAVEDGILPSGSTVARSKSYRWKASCAVVPRVPPGWKPGSTSAKMADA